MSLGSFSASVSVAVNHLRDQTELIIYEEMSINYDGCVSVFLP